jgi:hypothetical protein
LLLSVQCLREKKRNRRITHLSIVSIGDDTQQVVIVGTVKADGVSAFHQEMRGGIEI